MSGPEEPRFDHDCEACVFIGHVRQYDVYRCPQGGYPTIVARYGDEGPEYLSSSKLTLFVSKEIEVNLTYSMREAASG